MECVSPCSPVAFVQEASPMRPLVLIYNSMVAAYIEKTSKWLHLEHSYYSELWDTLLLRQNKLAYLFHSCHQRSPGGSYSSTYTHQDQNILHCSDKELGGPRTGSYLQKQIIIIIMASYRLCLHSNGPMLTKHCTCHVSPGKKTRSHGKIAYTF